MYYLDMSFIKVERLCGGLACGAVCCGGCYVTFALTEWAMIIHYWHTIDVKGGWIQCHLRGRQDQAVRSCWNAHEDEDRANCKIDAGWRAQHVVLP